MDKAPTSDQLNFPLNCSELYLIYDHVLLSPKVGHGSVVEKGSAWMRGTSRFWFHTMAAPELWMVVSSGWGFLGNKRGCWHRLNGAEGSPHRVPAAAPAGKGRDRGIDYYTLLQDWQEMALKHQLLLYFFSFWSTDYNEARQETQETNDKTWVRFQSSRVKPLGH